MKSRGFAYIALLLVIAGIMLSLGKASEDIAQSAAREREAQLLFVGKQFINAIGSYYRNSPQSNKQYPPSLADLITDNRFPKPAHHLRKLYIDPMTYSNEWGLVKNEQQQIIGVYSLAQAAPIKTDFEEKIKQGFGDNPLLSYADWKFIYLPQFDASKVTTNPSPP